MESAKDTFTGPVGIAIGYDDPALLAKKVLEFARENEKLEIKGGVLAGECGKILQDFFKNKR